MNQQAYYYHAISELKEASDFMRVIDKWEVLSHRLEAGPDVPMVLPDLFWVARSGVGKTHLLNLLSEYLYEAGTLMDFQGNEKYLEFMLDYYSPDQSFPEIARLIDAIGAAAGYRNSYKGILSVDIEEWLGHCEEKHFLSFLEFLSSNSSDWLIIFNVSGEQESEIKHLESILTMYFRLEKSILTLPDSHDLLAFVQDRLAVYGVELAPCACDLIYSVIEQLQDNKYFDGYKTLIILCQDIIYEIYSNAEIAVGQPIGADSLRRFAKDSKYIQRVTWKAENKSRIGLLNRGYEQ